MFAKFDEIPTMTLQNIKETKRYGSMDGQCENSIHSTNKVCGGYKNCLPGPMLQEIPSTHGMKEYYRIMKGQDEFTVLRTETIAFLRRLYVTSYRILFKNIQYKHTFKHKSQKRIF